MDATTFIITLVSVIGLLMLARLAIGCIARNPEADNISLRAERNSRRAMASRQWKYPTD